jgi:hypothetical protein
MLTHNGNVVEYLKNHPEASDNPDVILAAAIDQAAWDIDPLWHYFLPRLYDGLCLVEHYLARPDSIERRRVLLRLIQLHHESVMMATMPKFAEYNSVIFRLSQPIEIIYPQLIEYLFLVPAPMVAGVEEPTKMEVTKMFLAKFQEYARDICYLSDPQLEFDGLVYLEELLVSNDLIYPLECRTLCDRTLIQVQTEEAQSQIRHVRYRY